MRIDILTLFPDSAERVLGESIIGRAAAKGLITIKCRQIRDYSDNKQNQVDDYPYGGGWGCVMMAQPVYACLKAALEEAGEERTRVIYLSPQGARFTQETAKRLARDYSHLVLVCGHYEGMDERFIEECVDEELSIGDFVLTGGEIPAMAVTDAVCRLVPGVLANEECFKGESLWDGVLEYPQYTRPEVWRGRRVPEILRSGNHAGISYWRRKQSLLRTREKRPDLYSLLTLDDKTDKKILAEIEGVEAGAQKLRFDCRRAMPEDMNELMSIATQARARMREMGIDQWQDGYPNPEVFMEDMSKQSSWIFACGADCAGMVSIFVESEHDYDIISQSGAQAGGLYGIIHRLAVADAYRGRGLAEEMISFAQDICRGRGALSIWADTHRDNKPMRRLLEKTGFSERGTVYLKGNLERIAYEKVFSS